MLTGIGGAAVLIGRGSGMVPASALTFLVAAIALGLLTARADSLARRAAASERRTRRALRAALEAEEKLRTQLERLALLDRITRAIGSRHDPAAILDAVVASLETELHVDFACICLRHAEGNPLQVARVGSRSAALAGELQLTEGTSFAIEDLANVTDPLARQFSAAGLRSLVLAPLTLAAEGRALGALLAARRGADAFSSDDYDFLRQLAEHLALVLNQAQLYRALESAYQDMRQTQRHMIQQEHLRALGQMASGIAHDINNALSPASIYVHMIRAKDPNIGAESREQLAIVERAIEDVGNTVGRMREFYRRGEVDFTPAPVNLNEIIEHVIALTEARWSDIPKERGKVIDVRTELSAALPSIMGSESELRDGLINLVLNAVDAMPDGGTLTFRSRLAEEGRVCVQVSDTGVGMDEQTRRRCIEPFFTTKGERGTGLGLPMVYGMLERHSGEIEIESALGRGTQVSLTFPAAPQGDGSANGSYLAILPEQPLRVLAVDDDPLILSALRDILERDGHSVATAEGGQEGIDTFLAAEGRREPFDVVITDLGMPHIDGRRVAATVKATRAEVVVLLLTGWGRRIEKEGECPEHVDRILSKPPKLSDLRAALAAAEARVG